MNILISFSGGKTSAFMAKFILEHEEYKDYNKLIVFANTGKENEETLNFVDRCESELFKHKVYWVEAKVFHNERKGTSYNLVNYTTANRNGKPFEEVIKKYGLPSKLYRHCTRDLKESPINKFAKDYFNNESYITAIGIRADEKHRQGTKFYPLLDKGITKTIIDYFWRKQDFTLELKDYQGNCDFCFLKSERKKMTIAKETPEKLDWWAEMESKYSKQYQNIFDAQRHLSILDIKANSQKPFRLAIDKENLSQMQLRLFDIKLDYEIECFCSNT